MMKKIAQIVLLVFSLPLTAQVALVAHTVAEDITGTAVTTSTLNTTAANAIILCATAGWASDTTTPSDSLGNVWTLVGRQNEDGDVVTSMWVTIGPAVGPSHTFTFGAFSPTLEVMAFSGVASGPDQKSQSQGATPLTSGAMTPAKPNELVASCSAWTEGSTTAPAVTPLTVVDTTTAVYAGGCYGVACGTGSAYQVQTTAVSVNPTWSSNTGEGAAVSATFFSDLSPAALAISTTALAEGFVGQVYGSETSNYSNQLRNYGGVGPFSWSVVSGALPAGLSLSTTGVISGTPTAAVSATTLVFEMTDSQSNTATAALPLTVAAVGFSGNAGSCTGSALNATQLAAYGGCALSASGGTSPYSFSYSTAAGNYSIPEGMNLNASTGAITSNYVGGTGHYTPTFTIQDSLGTVASLSGVTFAVNGNYFNSCLPWAGSIFNQRVDSLPVDTSPAAPIYSGYQASTIRFLYDVPLGGIPYIVVPYNRALVPVTDIGGGGAPPGGDWSSGPIPAYNPIEGTPNNSNATNYIGDGHTLTLVSAGGGNSCQLYEMYNGQYIDGASNAWENAGDYFWNLGTWTMPEMDNGSTTDAAGLPVIPMLATVDEALSPNGIQHPMRFTANHMLAYQVWPAAAHAGVGSCTGGYEDDNHTLSQLNPPTSCTMTGPAGEIYRITSAAYTALAAANPCLVDTSGHPQSSALFKAMRQYGIILADNGGTGFTILANDARWNATDLACIQRLIPLSDFEPVMTAQLETTGDVTNAPTYQVIQETTAPAAPTGLTGSVI
jgi:hypothetical protein